MSMLKHNIIYLPYFLTSTILHFSECEVLLLSFLCARFLVQFSGTFLRRLLNWKVIFCGRFAKFTPIKNFLEQNFENLSKLFKNLILKNEQFLSTICTRNNLHIPGIYLNLNLNLNFHASLSYLNFFYVNLLLSH